MWAWFDRGSSKGICSSGALGQTTGVGLARGIQTHRCRIVQYLGQHAQPASPQVASKFSAVWKLHQAAAVPCASPQVSTFSFQRLQCTLQLCLCRCGIQRHPSLCFSVRALCGKVFVLLCEVMQCCHSVTHAVCNLAVLVTEHKLAQHAFERMQCLHVVGGQAVTSKPEHFGC